MEQLIEMAGRLGKQIADHQRTISLKKAQKEVDEDSETGQLVKDYQLQAQKIGLLEKEQKPIEVEDKHKLRDFEQKISTNPKLAELTRRQVDFVEMMRKVKQAIDEQLELQV